MIYKKVACTYVSSDLFTVDTAIDDALGTIDSYYRSAKHDSTKNN